MSAPDPIVSELTALLGADVVISPDSQNILRHISDYCVHGDPNAGIMALAYPRNTSQVAAILRYCNQHEVAVQPQGGMTGLSGGAVPVGPCVVLSLERMRAIRELDRAAGTITVEAGVVLEAVQKAADAAELFFPLDIGGRGSCQIGGNVSTNAGGNRVLRFGMARDLVLGVEAVLADGTIIDGAEQGDQEQCRLRPAATVYRLRRHAGRHHRGGAAPVPEAAQRMHRSMRRDGLRGRARPASARPQRLRLATYGLRGHVAGVLPGRHRGSGPQAAARDRARRYTC